MKRSDFLKFGGTAMLTPFIPFGAKEGYPVPERVKPQALKPGDTIGLTAPAGIVFEEEEFDRMKKVLEEFGLNVRFGEHVKKRHGYFSGTDEERAEDLNNMFADDSIDGIMAVRGGWGCARILPFLDFDIIRKNPKVYCGFSDNTTLHHAFLAFSGLVSYHGPNGNSDWSDLTKDYFQKVIMKGEQAEFISNSIVRTINPGKAEGVLIGGNLTILTTGLGTMYQAAAENVILFVEDIGERTYKIDRMLTHLSRAGILERINGFVFGKCTDCSAGSDPTFTFQQVLNQHLKPLDIPVIMNADIGHEEDNFTLPQGVKAVLDTDRGSIKLLEKPVA